MDFKHCFCFLSLSLLVMFTVLHNNISKAIARKCGYCQIAPAQKKTVPCSWGIWSYSIEEPNQRTALSVVCPSQVAKSESESESSLLSPSPSPRVRVKKKIESEFTNLVVNIYSTFVYLPKHENKLNIFLSLTTTTTTTCIECQSKQRNTVRPLLLGLGRDLGPSHESRFLSPSPSLSQSEKKTGLESDSE